MQVLENGNGEFYYWTRYGRVGYDGVKALERMIDKDAGKRRYNKVFKEKTGKGYTVVKMALGKQTDGISVKISHEEKKVEEKKNEPKSKLDAGV
jgi:hypothetical protein